MLPRELGRLSQLKVLDVSRNTLEGEMCSCTEWWLREMNAPPSFLSGACGFAIKRDWKPLEESRPKKEQMAGC